MSQNCQWKTSFVTDQILLSDQNAANTCDKNQCELQCNVSLG